MKNYVKPMLLANEELSEGVYAASGCFSGGGKVTQQLNGYYIYEISMHHNATHHSEYSCEVKITFAAGSGVITDATAHSNCSVTSYSGSTVECHTAFHFNETGDDTFKVNVRFDIMPTDPNDIASAPIVTGVSFDDTGAGSHN